MRFTIVFASLVAAALAAPQLKATELTGLVNTVKNALGGAGGKQGSGLAARGGMTTPAQVQASQCGNGDSISCCNTSESDKSADGGLAGIVGVGNVLSGSCVLIPVNVLGVQVPVDKMCGNLNAACCNGNKSQDGLVNLSADCTPINVI